MAREVKDNPRGAPVVDDGTTSDTLFPTVAVSDTINTLAHAYAAYVVLPVSMPAALGFALVALASAFGTLRFGFSPRIFRAGNDSLAELAAYVGLSLIGRAAATGPLSFLSTLDTTVFAVTLACVGAVARGLPKAVSDAVRTVVASSTFIIPVLVNGALRGDAVMASSALLFAAAGIAVRPERHTFLMGLRREDWFHFMISTASVGIALRLRASKGSF